MDRSHITGLVLAGGRGSRMGEVDKGLVSVHGQPLIRHVLTRLVPQVAGVLISANRNLDTYAALGHPVMADTDPGFPGPLAGMRAGLLACPTPWLLVVPCDAPALPLDLAQRLAAEVTANDRPAAVARTASGTQPVFTLLHRRLADSLGRFLDAGGRKVEDWQRAAGAVYADFDSANAFTNLNTPSELQRYAATSP